MKPEMLHTLLRAIEALEENPKLRAWNDLTRTQIFALAFEVIRSLPDYKELPEFSPSQAKEIITRLISGELTTTLPKNLQELLESYDKHTREIETKPLAPDEIKRWKESLEKKFQTLKKEPEALPVETKVPTTEPTARYVPPPPIQKEPVAKEVKKEKKEEKAVYTSPPTPTVPIKARRFAETLIGEITGAGVPPQKEGAEEKKPIPMEVATFEVKARVSAGATKKQAKKFAELLNEERRKTPVLESTKIGELALAAGMLQGQIPQLLGDIPEGTLIAPRQTLIGGFIARVRGQFGATAPTAPLPTPSIGPAGAVAKTGLGFLASKALSAVTAILGPQGWIARFLLPFAPRIAQKAGKYIAAGVIAIGGFLLGGLPLAFAAGGAAGLWASGASLPAIGSGLASGLSSAFYGVTNATIQALAVPVTVGMISIPIMVAIIMFIINSGAYIVPPSEETLRPVTPAGELCLPISGTISQLAYCETGQNSHCRYNSNAYDISSPIGTPIYAVHGGLAFSAFDPETEKDKSKGFGYYVKITGEGFVTYYAHLVENEVIPPGTSKQVIKGDLIGHVDSTGNSTGNHLHFELRSPKIHISEAFGAVTLGQEVVNCFGK